MNLLQLFEAESRFVIYINGKPSAHYATAAEAKKFVEFVRSKYPDAECKIKNEMHEDVEEGYKFKGGFPFDVDHMPGAVHKQDLDTKKKFTDEDLWLNTVNKLNSSLYDDNSDYISSGNGYRVEIMGKVWAKWDGMKDAGWIETSSLAEQQVDEVLAPDQLSKLQSIKSQLPKAGGQKPSVPTDADRAEADAWLAGLKGGTPAATAAAGEAPLNFDRPGRPRSASYSEMQAKIAKLKSIKGILKSISRVEPKATRAANKVGGSEEIETKSQMMADLINNLNISYTSEQELDSIERRLGEYLQQLTAKSAAWTRPNRASKHGAVTIIKPGQEVAEGELDEGWKQIAGAAALAGATALGGYAAGSRDSGNGFSNTKGIDQFNKPTAAHVQPLKTQADLDAYNKTRPPGTSKLLNLPSDFEESQVNEKEEALTHANNDQEEQDETSMFIKQLRMRNPQAKSDLAALAADYRQNVSHDGHEITRLDHENDREDADIARLDVENDHEQDDIARLKQLIQQLKQS